MKGHNLEYNNKVHSVSLTSEEVEYLHVLLLLGENQYPDNVFPPVLDSLKEKLGEFATRKVSFKQPANSDWPTDY